jgi:hypothetical protein
MKKTTEILIALILFFAFSASMSVATTNIDPVDYRAKVVLDGSYIDFGCPAASSTLAANTSSTAAQTLSREASSLNFSLTSSFQQNVPTVGVPGVESVSVSAATITDALSGGPFSIIITFTESIDQNNPPTIILSPDLVATGTLVFSDFEWLPENKTYTVKYRIVDQNEIYSSVSAQIVGAITQAIPGIPVEQYTAENLFSVDMASVASSTTTSQLTNCDVVVSDYLLTGSAYDQDGRPIVMNPIGGGVFNDAFGTLSGYAWGQSTGWINFAPTGGGVTIDGDGFFQGLAWSQNLGWIAFDCDTLGTCATDPFRVRTAWRPGGNTAATVATTTSSSSSSSVASTPSSVGGGSPVSTATSTTTTASATSVISTTSVIPSTSTVISPTTPTTSPTVALQIPVLPPIEPSVAAPVSTAVVQPTSPVPLESRSEEITGSSLLDDAVAVLFRGFENLAAFINTVRGDLTFKTVALVGALGAVLSTPGSVLRSALSVLAFRKRKPWGTVYDAVTKQPLDPAYVVLKGADGREITTSITDLDGRYGFLSDAGQFTIVANKTNYIFPSAHLSGRASDELYSDLYFGGPIDILNKGDVITKNIPLDPVSADWNETAKREQHLMKFYSKRDLIISRITNILFWFGFALSGFALAVAPEPLNIGIVVLYAVVFILKETLLKSKKRGMLTDKYGNPLSFAILRIFSANLNTEIIHKVANALGQYYALVPNGTYYAKIEVKNPDGSYVPVYTSEPFEVKKGVIDKNFLI